jgi:hypothetical protein
MFLTSGGRLRRVDDVAKVEDGAILVVVEDMMCYAVLCCTKDIRWGRSWPTGR